MSTLADPVPSSADIPAPLILDGASLTARTVGELARRPAPPSLVLDDDALTRVGLASALAADLSTRRVVYGRTTGVGANRVEQTSGADQTGHGLRLLRSHAGGTGNRLSPRPVRATMLVRLNQLLNGHSGVSPEVVGSLGTCQKLSSL